MNATHVTVTIDLDDVRAARGVPPALTAWCEASEETACGVIGPSFATSGPGSGWSCQFNESDYAVRAMEGGAIYYLDIDDGRVASAPDWTKDTYAGQPIEWTSESAVCIRCPSIEDALEHPALVAEMVQAIIDHHHPESDCTAWRRLIESIRTAAAALEDIDLDDLPALA